MTCYVFPESYQDEDDGIPIEAADTDDAIRQGQRIADDIGEEVDLWMPPDLPGEIRAEDIGGSYEIRAQGIDK